jgi:hypothetical protein
MKYDQMLPKLLFLIVLFLVQPAAAEPAVGKDTESQSSVAKFIEDIELPDVDLYRQPYVPRPTAYDQQKSCRQLELELRSLQPETYSYKPGFYEDPQQGAAIWVGTTMFWPAYGVVVWSAMSEYEEQGRMINAENRIAELRQLKADRRCFEQ